MGIIVGSYILPHPPLAISEVGRGEEKKISGTLDMMNQVSREIRDLAPDTIIVISPHAQVFRGSNCVHINEHATLAGDFSNFRAPAVKLTCENDLDFVAGIIKEAEKAGLRAGGMQRLRGNGSDAVSPEKGVGTLDHGTMVPLYFIDREYRNYRLVVISIAFMYSRSVYEFGKCIKRAIQGYKAANGGRFVIIASGDMSHKLTEDGPYGFDPAGPKFDKFFLECVEGGDIDSLIDIDGEFLDDAAQCGYYGTVMMFGALDGDEVSSETLSYEGPFGVGYSVVRIRNVQPGDAYVRLARETLTAFVGEGKVPKVPEWAPDEMLSRKAGVFVSLKKHGNLRGCIGTISPTCETIADEIIQNAISSCSRDPRFSPVRHDELEHLKISVDVLAEAEPVTSTDQLDVKRYGVIVSKGYRRGLLLPNLEGVDTIEEQIGIALQKAGIHDSGYKLERFEVVRHE